MASDIRVVHAREFLKVTAQGKFDLESSKRALQIVAEAGAPHLNLMIDVREAPAYLSLPEVSELLAEFARLDLGSGRKTAVLTDEERFGNAQFFAVSARGKGHIVQAFTSFEEAFDWLAL